MAEPLRLLIVCLGNICRSPMAEGALRARLREAGLEGTADIDSAGTGGWHVGDPPDPRSIAAAASHGVTIGDLRGRRLHEDDFRDFDWLLCADRSVLRDVRAAMPAGARAQAALLLEWAGMGQGAEIPDPYSGSEDDFQHVWRRVDAAAAAIVERLSARGAG